MDCLAPFRLSPWFSPRPWGTMDLSPWYDLKPSEPIGESWLTGDACTIETGPFTGKTLRQALDLHPQAILGHDAPWTDFPLLLKLLFPNDKLSVQVHPDDLMANEMGQPRGKTECWYVLDATPGAFVSLGLVPGASLQAVRAAIADQTLENLLVQVPVKKGDMIFVDAGTVHAIGPGVVLLETQQTSDITFRMYDYGRPRELHIDRALQATRPRTRAGKVQPIAHPSGQRLIQEQYFIVDRFPLSPGQRLPLGVGAGIPQAFVLLEGSATLVAEGEVPLDLRRGQAAVLPACAKSCELRGESAAQVIRSMPPRAA
jgi:mannose-6-phosphate isomerase